MSLLKEKLEALNDALHRALDFADPEAALRRAEQEFKNAAVAEVEALKARMAELEAKFILPAAPTPVPEPLSAAPVPESDPALAPVAATIEQPSA